MRVTCWLLAGLISVCNVALAGVVFSEDIKAYPKVKIDFNDESIDFADAIARTSQHDDQDYRHKIMTFQESKYLCSIPRVPEVQAEKAGEAHDKKESIGENSINFREKGLELLQPLEGNCLYLNTGWWTYAYCHNQYVKQFHRQQSQPGQLKYPPVEDSRQLSFFLGVYSSRESARTSEQPLDVPSHFQTDPSYHYLLQRYENGSFCGLVGRPRSVEVQIQCDPTSQDQILWVKETSTCSYVMHIITPRLCNEVAFRKQDSRNNVHPITCRMIQEYSQSAGRLTRDGWRYGLPDTKSGSTNLERLLSSAYRYREERREYDEEHNGEDGVFEADAHFAKVVKHLVSRIEHELEQGTFRVSTADGKSDEPIGKEDHISFAIEVVDDNGIQLGQSVLTIDKGKVKVEKADERKFDEKAVAKLPPEIKNHLAGYTDRNLQDKQGGDTSSRTKTQRHDEL